ncbi:hypothetical protein [Plantactinospora sp. KLBMP9567]|uniref:hypothetical protein n=1 Tax=Plantactinospora sp. KLBMP9567 TaxID=3085900 RepID=UPI0029828A1B|nr:hypothetical protein [Plantactinospora sp. KLBMP9567]MDW5328373.1 hypothetical protein [Plantactinospora sp. KLBMP9567]
MRADPEPMTTCRPADIGYDDDAVLLEQHGAAVVIVGYRVGSDEGDPIGTPASSEVGVSMVEYLLLAGSDGDRECCVSEGFPSVSPEGGRKRSRGPPATVRGERGR